MDLIIIRGLPGSGKGTLAKTIVSVGISDVWYEADMYFTEPDGSYKFHSKNLQESHTWCQEMVRAALIQGKNVTVSNTFTRVWEFQPYIDMGEELGANIIIVEAEGGCGSVHNVPEKTMRSMRARWEASPLRYSSPVVELHNPKLKGIDPFDPSLSEEIHEAISEECKRNAWYFLTKIMKLSIPTRYYNKEAC